MIRCDACGHMLREHDKLLRCPPVERRRSQTFVLRRREDETGLSGTGDVAWGVLFPDGVVVTRWCVTDVRQTCVWRSLDDVRAVHCHLGKTVVVFLDSGDSLKQGPGSSEGL